MLRRLDREEMKEIFEKRMRADFPPAELKPWKRIQEMLDEGVYFACGLFWEGKLLAYAFFVEAKEGQLLLDYYAVAAEARDRGIGSRCLELMKKELKKQGGSILLIEVENPATAKSGEEELLRQKRISFYERNGVRPTALRSRLFDVDYRIMYLPLEGERKQEDIRQAVDVVYHTMFPKECFGRDVWFGEENE